MPTTLITGSTGIAAATAQAFLSAGFGVLVLDRSSQNLETIKTQHPQLETFCGDLLEPETSINAVQHCLEKFGRLDVLVNVAGISGRRYGDAPVHQATDEGWDTVMDSNAKTTFMMCRAALAPMMAQGSGSIVNTASVLAYAPNKDFFATHAYAACNGARIALTKSMAAYYAQHGIRVNAIAPGLIATPMSARAQNNPEILAYIEQKQPITQSLGTPQDCAQAIYYLATAPFITGVVLEVAGGWSVAG
jgi:NAD(P)-dependent dehydrogenase (short-subunit alcohol dehydrogenase family)